MTECDRLSSKLIIFIYLFLTCFLSLLLSTRLTVLASECFLLSRPLSFQPPKPSTTISIPASYVPYYFCHRASSSRLPWALPSVGQAARSCPWSRTSVGLCFCLELCWAHGRAAAARRGKHQAGMLPWVSCFVQGYFGSMSTTSAIIGGFRNVLPQLHFVREPIMLPRS